MWTGCGECRPRRGLWSSWWRGSGSGGYARRVMGSARFRTRRRQLGAIVLAACVVAPIFNVLTSEASAREAWQGVVDGVVVSLLVGSYMLFARNGRLRPFFQKLRFWTDLALSSIIVLALFLVGRATGKMLTTLDPHRFVMTFAEPHPRHAAPFLAVCAVISPSVLHMNPLGGATVLGSFMAGVYHRPRAEERIFLFLALQGSPRLAEELGSARYFELLRRFVDDV